MASKASQFFDKTLPVLVFNLDHAGVEAVENCLHLQVLTRQFEAATEVTAQRVRAAKLTSCLIGLGLIQ